MGTSRSSSAKENAEGGAFLFSGRPDPAWPVPAHVVRRLLEIWESLSPDPADLPLAPSLGYRGCYLKDASGREWTAYQGVVHLQTPDDSQTRRDDKKSFEKTLLASAPDGALPTSLLANIC
jgi:hypothetical protein